MLAILMNIISCFCFSADKVISSKKTKTFLEEVEEKLNGMYIQVAVLVT